MSRLPKDQDCHELWSRMMKKALRERMARPTDDHSTDTQNSSTVLHPKITAAATAPGRPVSTVSSHNCLAKNTTTASITSSSLLMSLPSVLGQQPSSHGIGSQANVDGLREKPAALQSSSSSSLHASYSSYLTHMAGHFDRRNVTTNSPRARTPTTANHR